MSEFCNLIYDHQFQNEENKDQGKGIDIVDFHTVGFYKDNHLPKRSLSLNIYEYKKTLAPIDCEKSIKSVKAPTGSIKEHENFGYPLPALSLIHI